MAHLTDCSHAARLWRAGPRAQDGSRSLSGSPAVASLEATSGNTYFLPRLRCRTGRPVTWTGSQTRCFGYIMELQGSRDVLEQKLQVGDNNGSALRRAQEHTAKGFRGPEHDAHDRGSEVVQC